MPTDTEHPIVALFAKDDHSGALPAFEPPCTKPMPKRKVRDAAIGATPAPRRAAPIGAPTMVAPLTPTPPAFPPPPAVLPPAVLPPPPQPPMMEEGWWWGGGNSSGSYDDEWQTQAWGDASSSHTAARPVQKPQIKNKGKGKGKKGAIGAPVADSKVDAKRGGWFSKCQALCEAVIEERNEDAVNLALLLYAGPKQY